MKRTLSRTRNQGWKIAFGSIGVQKTMKFDGFAKQLAPHTPVSQGFQIAAISGRVMRILNRAMQHS